MLGAGATTDLSVVCSLSQAGLGKVSDLDAFVASFSWNSLDTF
jgi:hypothetical protein